MSKKYFISSPSYGFISKKFSRFNDLNLFKTKSYLFTKLNKIKIWYGPATVKGINKQPKVILGIEPNYRFLGKNDEKPKRYISKLSSNDIEVKELTLKNNSDYFCKMYLCVEDIITYIKLVSKNGEVLESGKLVKKDEFNTDVKVFDVLKFDVLNILKEIEKTFNKENFVQHPIEPTYIKPHYAKVKAK